VDACECLYTVMGGDGMEWNYCGDERGNVV